jgi:hypothetical protein
VGTPLWGRPKQCSLWAVTLRQGRATGTSSTRQDEPRAPLTGVSVRLMPAVLLGDCTWFGPGHVYADKDAPYTIGKLKSALLYTDDSDNRWGKSGDGVLFLSDQEHDCDAIEDYDDDSDLCDGNGIVFLMSYWADEDVDDPWAGIWQEGYSYAGIQDIERNMVAVPFTDGQLIIGGFDYYGLGETGWLKLEEGEDQRRGEFDASSFHGKFKAETCGESSGDGGGGGDDSGWR